MTEADRPGLRERKKAKTSATIRRCALRLFAERGYDATTVSQIAAEAEVSPSTFFRYFPTKEAVVLRDELDPLLLRAFEAQPTSLRPVPAFRRACRAVLGALAAGEREEMRQRVQLMRTVPAVRAAFLEEMVRATRLLEEAVARRTGRDSGDASVRALAGALMGVMVSVLFHGPDDADLGAAVDEALAAMETALAL